MISRSQISHDVQYFVRIEVVVDPRALIEDLGWTWLESALKIIIMNVEKFSFGYDLTIGHFVKRVLPALREDPRFLKLVS